MKTRYNSGARVPVQREKQLTPFPPTTAEIMVWTPEGSGLKKTCARTGEWHERSLCFLSGPKMCISDRNLFHWTAATQRRVSNKHIERKIYEWMNILFKLNWQWKERKSVGSCRFFWILLHGITGGYAYVHTVALWSDYRRYLDWWHGYLTF